MTITSSISPMPQMGIIIGRHKKGISRDIQWYSAWAAHYLYRGGLGAFFGGMYITAITLYYVPVVNTIIHLALSRIYQNKQSALIKRAFNESNAEAACILADQTGNVSIQSNEGKTLLDLFAEQGTREGKLSAKSLEKCKILFEKEIKADFSHKGFSVMLDSALKQMNFELVMHLMGKDVKPTDSWTHYLAELHSDQKPLPDWCEDTPFVQKARENPFLKFSDGESVVGDFIHTCFTGRTSPLILGDTKSERDSLMYATGRRILSGDVPSYLERKQIVDIDLATIIKSTTLDNYLKQLKRRKGLIYYVHNFEVFDTENPHFWKLMKPKLLELTETGRAVFSMPPKIYEEHFAERHQTAFTHQYVKEPSKEETKRLLKEMKCSLEVQYKVTFSQEAIDEAERLSKYIPHSSLPDTPFEILKSAAILMRREKAQGSITLQNEEKKRDALRSDLFNLSLLKRSNASKGKKEKEHLEKKIEEATERIKTLKEQIPSDKEAKEKYLQLKGGITYLGEIRRRMERVVRRLEDEMSHLEGAKLSKKQDDLKEFEKWHETFQEQASPLLENLQKELQSTEKKKSQSSIHFEVDSELVSLAASKMANMSLGQIGKNEADLLSTLEENLSKSIFGQENAVKATAEAIATARYNLEKTDRPISLIYAGSSGVGKTSLAEALATELFGDKDKLTVIDMSGFTGKENKSDMVGAAHGYIGYEKAGGELTKALKKNPRQVILLDEFDKAHREVIELLFPVLDRGRLTDGDHNKLDCSQAIFILTTNLGSDELLKNVTAWSQHDPGEIVKQAILAARDEQGHKKVSSAMFGRISSVIPFVPLQSSHRNLIIEKLLQDLEDVALERHGIDLLWDKSAITEQLMKENGDRREREETGVRYLEKLVLKHITQPLKLELIKRGKKHQRVDSVEISYNKQAKKYQFLVNEERRD